MHKFDLTPGHEIADPKINETIGHEFAKLLTKVVEKVVLDHLAIHHQEKEKEVEKEPEPEKKEKIYKTRKQTCEILNISAPTLWKLTKSGKIPSLKIEGRVLYDLEQIYLSLKPRNFSPKK